MSLIQAKQISKILGTLRRFDAAFTLAAGTTVNLATTFSGKVAGGSNTAVGVFTTSPNNRVALVNSDNGNTLQDGEGNLVYGRLDGTFALTYYTIIGGAETAYTVLATNEAIGKPISVVYGEAVQLKDISATDVVSGLDSIDQTDFDPNSHVEAFDEFTPTNAQTVFTLTRAPRANSVKFFVNGLVTNDFTVSGSNVTYGATAYALETTDTVRIVYNA